KRRTPGAPAAPRAAARVGPSGAAWRAPRSGGHVGEGSGAPRAGIARPWGAEVGPPTPGGAGAPGLDVGTALERPPELAERGGPGVRRHRAQLVDEVLRGVVGPKVVDDLGTAGGEHGPAEQAGQLRAILDVREGHPGRRAPEADPVRTREGRRRV